MLNIKNIPEEKSEIKALIATPLNIPFDGEYSFPINLNDVLLTHNTLAGDKNYILSNNLTISNGNVLKYNVDFNLIGKEISGTADNIKINEQSLDKRKFLHIENGTIAGTGGTSYDLGPNLYFDTTTGWATLRRVAGGYLYQQMFTLVNSTEIVGQGYYFFTNELSSASIIYDGLLQEHFYIINQSEYIVTVGGISVGAGEMCIIYGDEKVKSTEDLPPDTENEIILADDNDFVITDNVVNAIYNPIDIYDFSQSGTVENPIVKIKTEIEDLEFTVKGPLGGVLTKNVNYTVAYSSINEEYTISFTSASNGTKYGTYNSAVTGGVTGNSDNTSDGSYFIYCKGGGIKERLIYKLSVQTTKSLITGTHTYNITPFTYELTGNLLTDGKILGSNYTLTSAKISQGTEANLVPLVLGTPVTYDGITSVIQSNGDYTITTTKNVYKNYPIFEITVTNANGVIDTGTRIISVSQPIFPDPNIPLRLFVRTDEISELNILEYFGFFGNFHIVQGLGEVENFIFGTATLSEDGHLAVNASASWSPSSIQGFNITLSNGFEYFLNIRIVSVTYRSGGFTAEFFRIALNGYFSQILIKLWGETDYIILGESYNKGVRANETTGELITDKVNIWDGNYWRGTIENRLSIIDNLPEQQTAEALVNYIGASDARPANMGNNIEWLGAGGTSRLPVTTFIIGRDDEEPFEIQEILISPVVSGDKYMALPNRLRISVDNNFDLEFGDWQQGQVFQTDITDNDIPREWYPFDIESRRDAMMKYGGFFRLRFRITPEV